MALRLVLIIVGAAVFLAATACGKGDAGPGIVAIAVNTDASARPRLAFYAGVPGRDGFVLPAGNYDLIAMDMSGGVASQSRPVGSGEDVAAATLATLRFPAATEDAGRTNREAMRNLFLFFARFSDVQVRLDDLVTAEHSGRGPASPDELTATEILGEEGTQGRVQGIRDWETKMASWGRALELGLGNLQAELPVESGGMGSPFADVEALVRGWRDGAAADRRAFLAVADRLSAARRVELYAGIAATLPGSVWDSPADFYRAVESGELDNEMWAIANFAYENDWADPATGESSYGEVARAEALEPGRPYYDRWLRQSPSAWGLLWSVSVETAKQARLPAEVLEVGGQRVSAAEPPVGGGLQAGSP